MAGYGYESDSYGYGSYGYGGGYYASVPLIYRYSIEDQLDGPGSSAYHRYGDVTAYAHENANGAVFEQDIAQFGNGYQIATSYDYQSDGYGYSHYSSFSYTPNGSSNGFYYGYEYHALANARYSSFDRTTVADGNYSTNRLTSFSYNTYLNGSYFQSTGVQGAQFENGQVVPGSSVNYGTSTYYDATTGYTTTHAYPE